MNVNRWAIIKEVVCNPNNSLPILDWNFKGINIAGIAIDEPKLTNIEIMPTNYIYLLLMLIIITNPPNRINN